MPGQGTESVSWRMNGTTLERTRRAHNVLVHSGCTLAPLSLCRTTPPVVWIGWTFPALKESLDVVSAAWLPHPAEGERRTGLHFLSATEDSRRA